MDISVNDILKSGREEKIKFLDFASTMRIDFFTISSSVLTTTAH